MRETVVKVLESIQRFHEQSFNSEHQSSHFLLIGSRPVGLGGGGCRVSRPSTSRHTALIAAPEPWRQIAKRLMALTMDSVFQPTRSSAFVETTDETLVLPQGLIARMGFG